MSFSQIQIIGHTGKDPEMTYTADGTAVTKFSVAVSKKSKNAQGEAIETTTWFNCTAWRGLAEMLNTYLTKGAQVFCQGELTCRQYITKDNKAGFSLDVTVDKFAFAGSKGNGANAAAQGRNSGADMPPSDDEAPF